MIKYIIFLLLISHLSFAQNEISEFNDIEIPKIESNENNLRRDLELEFIENNLRRDLELIEKVDDFYHNAWLKLIGVFCLIPVLIYIIQHLGNKLLRKDLEKDSKNYFKDELEKLKKQLFHNVNENNLRDNELTMELVDSLRNHMVSELIDVDGLIMYGFAQDYLIRKEHCSAITFIVSAIESFIRSKNNKYLRNSLDILITNIPHLEKKECQKIQTNFTEMLDNLVEYDRQNDNFDHKIDEIKSIWPISY